MDTLKTTKLFIKHGKNLTPLRKHGKSPFLGNWQNMRIPKEKIMYYINKGHNVGWVLSKEDLILDVDPRNGGDESLKRLEQDLNTKFKITVKTAGGGFHVYMKKPSNMVDVKLHKIHNKYKGIDFLTVGMQCVIPGSSIGTHSYSWQEEPSKDFPQEVAPIELLNLLNNENDKTPPLQEQHKKRPYKQDKHDDIPSEEEMARYLGTIDPDIYYDGWIRIGMGLHSYDPHRGFLLWDEWSKRGVKYEKGRTEHHWKSFTQNNGITYKTVLHYAEKPETLKKLKNDISQASDVGKLIQTLDTIKTRREFNKAEIKDLHELVKNKASQDFEVKLGAKHFKIEKPQEKPEKPLWCDDWIYVDSHGSFFNIPTRTFYRKESFDIMCGEAMPVLQKGTQTTASKFVTKYGFIKVAHTAEYIPQDENMLIVNNGVTTLNTYDHNSRPTAEPITEENEWVPRMVFDVHLRQVICNNDEYLYNILINWLAHNVQNPGKKIPWAIIIHSCPGMGKSFIGEMLRAVMGEKNVKKASPMLVLNQFNEWSVESCVTVLEELKISGANRHEFLNHIKTLITDKSISVNGKYKKPYTTQNTTNYLSFTNHEDCIPIETMDRRWCIIKVKNTEIERDVLIYIDSVATSEQELKIQTQSQYYQTLFETLNYSGVLLQWFLDYKIDESFYLLNTAPITEYKTMMANTEEEMKPGFIEIENLIKDTGTHFNPEVISSSYLFKALNHYYPDVVLDNNSKNLRLKALGYTIAHKRFYIDGEEHKIWSKNYIEKDEVLKIFAKYEKKPNKTFKPYDEFQDVYQTNSTNSRTGDKKGTYNYYN